MAIIPSPTIAGKLRKLFNNNKQTIEPAIGNSIPGGGGANVLTLYVNSINTGPNSSPSRAYKNPECTEEYESYIEASDAIRNVDIIQIVDKTSSSLEQGAYSVFTAINKGAMYVNEGQSMVLVTISTMNVTAKVALWFVYSEDPI